MAKKGRPPLEDPKNKRCMIRLNNAENDILQSVRKMTGMGEADVFRTALERMYEEERRNNHEQED